MEIKDLEISGCFELTPNKFEDNRGSFVKTWHDDINRRLDCAFDLQEEFYSLSNKDVIRGLHFQTPPSAHSKIVYCAQGAVLDIILDIRKSSPSYGKIITIELNSSNCKILYLPVGIAHGFLSLEDNSLMMYKTDHVYSPEDDDGINIMSQDFDLPFKNRSLIMSGRDSNFPDFNLFDTPFL